MKRFLPIIILAGLAFSTGCTSTKTQQQDSPVLLEFSQDQVSQSEFERVYAKNNGGLETASTHTPEQLREYLDLYIKFKRKVFEAEAMGLDTTPAFEQEFNSYKQQLTQPYLAAKDVEEQLIREAFDRSGWLVDVSHILITVDQNAAPADSLAAYQRALSLRDSVLTGGKEFGKMAMAYSNDPSAQQNQGKLGYFSAFDMVYPFETGAFETAVGDISLPVRSQYGYHIILVHDKMINQGKKKAAHIIVRIGDRYSAKNQAEAEAKIGEIHQLLLEGGDFAELARQYSDDPSSAPNGGDLGYNRLLPEMESYRLQLEEGAFSEPFQTRFGMHILAVTEVEKPESFEEARPQLKQRISRDSRAQLSQVALINRIKKEGHFQLNESAWSAFTDMLDDRFSRGSWEPDSMNIPLFDETLFSLAEGAVTKTISDFVTYYRRTRMRRMGLSAEDAAASILAEFEKQELLKYEETQLPLKNPEYRYLLQEYRDGILLFTLMEQKVWKKAVEDTAGLKAFYEANPEAFTRNRMVDVTEYRASEQGSLDNVKALIERGLSREAIDSVMNQESSIRLRSTSMLYEEGEDRVPERIFEGPVGTVTDVMEEGSFFRLLVSTEKFPAGIQPLDNVKSEAITRYQDHLEQEWLAELAEKYPVNINEKAFGQLFQ